ncbi:uncharacterized protein LOC130895003 isoform X2 [Diorhabda carinulata]|uniref:uncharacterized protein LOC130895003 isoform X2 n=1 Tax=Diorhabda carinulata TaxID=1163345 RepID=UPI0025A0DD34|nr:uncharacterized protein LOC130895003 isoform X2 [Diorhabda carinulata]
MSRHPQYEYEYPANYEQDYYIDEHEGFIADYSDSDCLADLPPQNLHTVPISSHVSDIYGEDSTIVPVKVVPLNKATKLVSKQHSEKFIQKSYCDRNMMNQSSVPISRPCYSDVRDHSTCFYPVSTASQHDANYGTKAFRSAYHNYENIEHFNCQNCHPPKPMNHKRLPITVRTPKYYRKSLTTGVFKRPSALCLPVAVQPDPNVIRRPKKSTLTENVYGNQETQVIKPVAGTPMLKKMSKEEFPHHVDSQGDLNKNVETTNKSFDDYVEQMEKTKCRKKAYVKPDMTKIAKLLKPRIPATIKARQEKSKAKTMGINRKSNLEKADNETKKQNNKDVYEVDQISLEKLLNQLKKCEITTDKEAPKKEGEVVNKTEKQAKESKSEKENSDRKSENTDDEKFDLRSFNYQDITQNLFRSQCDFRENSESVASIQDITKKLTSTTVRPQPLNTIKPLDDHCALELHKSKSYIVNLIDRALSKELGTVPGDRNRNEFEAMNPKKAIETVNRHLARSDRDLSVKITNALTDSLISNVTSRELDEDREEKEKLCRCQSNTEEPIYIKQLKQLRWGHLKHIQREVKRLEDLERFLDSCSITTIPEL